MANTIRTLTEQKNDILAQMLALTQTAETEQRSLTAEEIESFTRYQEELSRLNGTIDAIAHTRTNEVMTKQNNALSDEETARRSLESYVRGVQSETRSLDVGTNGGVIPETIVNRIIETVKETCPIMSRVTVYYVGGDLVFPVWNDTKAEGNTLGAAYVDDMTELTANAGKFTTIKLENHIAGLLTLVSKSLLNRSDFNLLDFIVTQVAKKITEFLEKELVLGTNQKMTGVISAEVGVTAASQTAITADEIIDLEMSIPQCYAKDACFIMHKSTLKKLRKLKTTDNEYLMNRDITAAFGWSLLGHSVYITESMPQAAAGNKAIVYGDMSGLYMKFAQGMDIQVLNEKYATQHAVGVVAYVECDSKIVEPQKIRTLQMAAAPEPVGGGDE